MVQKLSSWAAANRQQLLLLMLMFIFFLGIFFRLPPKRTIFLSPKPHIPCLGAAAAEVVL